MHFMDFSPELIADQLLKFLDWNDLLRLRRVCKWTKCITDAYINVNPEITPEIEINELDKHSFRAFVEMGIQTTKLFINNPSGNTFYEKDVEALDQFLEQYGASILYLRVDKINTHIYNKEWDFFEGLVNLKCLKAETFASGKIRISPDIYGRGVIDYSNQLAEKDPRHVMFMVPDILKICETAIGKDEKSFLDNIAFSRLIWGDANKLQYTLLPSVSNFKPPSTPILAMAFSDVINYMNMRVEAVQEHGKLECFDFHRYHNEYEVIQHLVKNVEKETNWNASPNFLDICKISVANNVQLANISPFWFMRRCSTIQENTSPALGIPIISVVNIHPVLLSLNMPNLEKITILNSSRCGVGHDWKVRPEWPALKIMDITVQDILGVYWDYEQQMRVEQFGMPNTCYTINVLNLLFRDIVRPNVTELKIRYDIEKSLNPTFTIPKPRSKDIVASCPNLTILTLKDWIGTNKALFALWSGLPRLKEISLECCKELGNVAFVGEDAGNPVFLKLKHLKKLSLKDLDQMPKITDTLFSLVLCQMKLSHLVLTSNKPLEKVTSRGINSLLSGPFAATIEKFPFHGWSLANTSGKELNELGTQFRTKNML